MKVFIAPNYQGPDRADGGIRRVTEALVKYLPDFGIHVTSSPSEADLLNCHGTELYHVPGVPMVSSCHGLYWEDYQWGDWAHDANKRVVESLIRSQAITAPSKWVAHAISRGMLANPTVIYHGVDADIWAHNDDPMGYVLWNKARQDAVSNPDDMQRLAAMLPKVPFVSTFGDRAENVHILGALNHDQIKPIIQRAGIYLATARETFGIGTLEALAAGVPVVGWRYGGQEEIVIEGETGYLATPGNYIELADCVRLALRERDRLSINARQDALMRWAWADKVEQYADLFWRVAERWNMPGPKVSVIVTCHNLARYLPDALQSVEQQTSKDFECILVDDCSADETQQVGEQWQAEAAGRTYLRTPTNLKLSGARNHGFYHARGKYVLFLDADDMLAPNAVDTLSQALDSDPALHIAAGRLDVMNDRGEERRRNPWPQHTFTWRDQMAHLNQITYASMMRRDVLERSGGYRERDWRAEDAAFWCRVTSLGFRAQIVTEDSTLIYRLRSDSKSAEEGRQHVDRDGDWTAWYPWRVGAATGQQGVALRDRGAQAPTRLVPWAAQGPPPASIPFWPVRHHQHPVVSVIIPVGPGHEKYLVDALDSLMAQTFQQWEVIVVNDGPKPLSIPSHSFARVINSVVPLYDDKSTYASLGAGAARNTGIREARAPLCLFLDADDVLVPTAIEKLVSAYLQSGGKYAYCDCMSPEDPARLDGPMVIHPASDYDQALWLSSGYEDAMPGRHSVTALVETAALQEVGGFDETMAHWEDWELYLKLAAAGICGVRVPEPLLIYRLHTGERRKGALKKQKELRAYLRKRYAPYTTGEIAMCGCKGGTPPALQFARMGLEDISNGGGGGVLSIEEAQAEQVQVVRLQFIGDQTGAQSYRGKATGKLYRMGNNAFDRYVDIPAPTEKDWQDIRFFVEGLQICKIVTQPPPARGVEPEPIEHVLEALTHG